MIDSDLNLITIFSVTFAGVAASAALGAFSFTIFQQRSNIRKEFILWAIDRLHSPKLRESRGLIFSITDEQIKEMSECIDKGINSNNIDAIREVCLSFDEIGYFIYKFNFVNFKDILDIYPQVILIWNKILPLVETWRKKHNDNTTFIYFDMLVHQKRFKVNLLFENPKSSENR